MADDRRPCRGHAARRGPRRDRAARRRRRSRGPPRRSRAWSPRPARRDVEAIAAVGTAGLRIAANSAAFIDAVRERTRRRDRGHHRRGGGPAGLPAAAVGARRRRRLARRLRHRRRQLAVHVRPLATASTSASASTSARCGFTERYGLDGPCDERRWPRRSTAIAAELARLDGRPGPKRGRDGRRRHEPRRRQARARDLRPRRRPRHGPRPCRDRPADRALPPPRRRGAPRRSSASSPSRAEVILAGACIVRTVLAKLGATRSPSATAACGTASSSSASGTRPNRVSTEPCTPPRGDDPAKHQPGTLGQTGGACVRRSARSRQRGAQGGAFRRHERQRGVFGWIWIWGDCCGIAARSPLS